MIASLAIAFTAWQLRAEPRNSENSASLYAPATCHDMCRAGCPRLVGSWAVPNNTCDYDGYYVGGGKSTYRCAGRGAHQGTWGWDYTGRLVPRVVALGWWHPPRYQGGTGAYEPDGPHYIEEIEKHFEHEEHEPAHHGMHYE
jgi:hypothetical protein